MQALAVLDSSGPKSPSARMRYRRSAVRIANLAWVLVLQQQEQVPGFAQDDKANLSGDGSPVALQQRNDIEGRGRHDDAAFRGREAKHEGTLARGATEALSLIDAREKDAPHDDHDD